jgi:hypothetical protein
VRARLILFEFATSKRSRICRATPNTLVHFLSLHNFIHFRNAPPTQSLIMLEAHDDVIGVAHDDDLTSGMALSPSVCPGVEEAKEIDIG